jgi:predicted nucleotidyltransferase
VAAAREWARELAGKLEAQGVRVDRILLFGSIARGDWAEGSDVDLIVVSRDWQGMSMSERLSLLYRLWDKPMDAHFVPLTPRELEERVRVSVALRDASQYWVEVYRGKPAEPSPGAARSSTRPGPASRGGEA